MLLLSGLGWVIVAEVVPRFWIESLLSSLDANLSILNSILNKS